MSNSTQMDRVLDGMLSFNAETKETLDSIKETMDKVFNKHYQANHEPFTVVSFPEEYRYWENLLADTINEEAYRNVKDLDCSGVELMKKRTYVIIRCSLKSGKTIRFNESRYQQLYINGKRYTGDYTFNGGTPETYEKLVLVLVQNPYNLEIKDWGSLTMIAEDFPIDNAEVFCNIGKETSVQPDIYDILLSDTVESFYVDGDWIMARAGFYLFKTLSVTGLYSVGSGVNHPKVVNLELPNTHNVISFNSVHGIRHLDISNASGFISEQGFHSCWLEGTLILNKISKIEEGGFTNNKFSRVHFGSTLTTIAKDGFMNNTLLKELVLPDSLTGVHYQAFGGCTGLTYVKFGERISRIEDRAFADCHNLETVVFGKNITTMFSGTFTNCTSLKNIIVPKGYHCPVTYITSSRVFNWRCFKDVLENCAVVGEDNRVEGTMVFKVASNVVTELNNAATYDGDDESLLEDAIIANEILDLCIEKSISITA